MACRSSAGLPGYRNLIVASGHAMLGMTLAPATGEAVAELITTGYAPHLIAPFDPARFGERGTPPAPTMATSGAWRSPAYVRMWSASVISALGSAITAIALPLLAVLTLSATPFQMGLLIASETVPILLFGLPTGVWVDRRPKRPVMIAADIGRAALLLLVPVALARCAAHRALAGHRVSGRHALCFLRDCLAVLPAGHPFH